MLAAWQAELEAELQQELAAYGVDTAAERMTVRQYQVALAALGRRGEEALRQRPPADQARARHLHATMLWHLHQARCGCLSPVEPTLRLGPKFAEGPAMRTLWANSVHD